MLKIISRIFIKIISYNLQYLRKKLLITNVIYGPSDRIHIGQKVDLQDVILNTSSGHIYIGDHTFFGHGCMVLTGTHDISKKNRERQQMHPTSGRDIIIGNGVWISSGAIICGNVKIADNVVIAAGAIVINDCSEAAVYGGIPAKKLYSISNS